jgi:hypothetical protein
MAIVVIVLMYTASFKLRLSPYVTIHNQCSNTKLVSPVYFGNGAVCPKLSGRGACIGTKSNISFEINTKDDFEGALLFKLQKCSDNQSNIDASTTETNENESTHVYMLAVWKVMDSKPLICVVLVEHTKEFTWSEDVLKKLYDNNRDWIKEYSDPVLNTWFMDDNMVLKTSFKARGLKDNFELSISISEERGDDYVMRPIWINTER